ncbi:MAG: CPBP family intramembrane glutamic endopeptidase [Planctomycetota bacterium]
MTTPRHPLLALALLVPAPTLGALAGLWWFPGTALGTGLFLAAKLWLLALPLAWHRAVDCGRWSWSPPRQGGFAVGLISGVLIAGLVVTAWLVLGGGLIDRAAVRATAATTGLDDPGAYLVMALYWCSLNAVLEEYVWRWFVAGQAASLLPRAGAVVLAALAFTAHHVIALRAYFDWPVVLLGALGVAIGGAWWSWMYLRYRSIWPGLLSHICADIAVFAIGWQLVVA